MINAAGTVCVLNQGKIGTPLVHWLRRLPGDVALLMPQGNQIPRQRNEAAHYGPGKWILFIDSDSVPPIDTLNQLLHWDVEIVGSVILERFSPFDLVAIKSLAPPERFKLSEIPKSGLIETVAVGTGCLLIRRSVFDKVVAPWFRCGQIFPDLLLEDTNFCLDAGKAGIPIFMDCAVRVGHATDCVIWPGRDGRPWVEWVGPVDRREPVEDVMALRCDVEIGDRGCN